MVWWSLISWAKSQKVMRSQGLFPESGDQRLLCNTSFTTALVSVYMLLGYTAARACAGSRSLIQFTRLFFLVRGWSLGTLSWGTYFTTGHPLSVNPFVRSSSRTRNTSQSSLISHSPAVHLWIERENRKVHKPKNAHQWKKMENKYLNSHQH